MSHSTRKFALVPLLGLFVFFLSGKICLIAQVTTADIVGTVTDPNGAAVAGATVTATDTGTGAVKTGTTADSGDFSFTLLQVGSYKVSVQAPGFKSYTTNVTLAAGDRARVSATLTLGQTSETVEVQSTTPALQSDTSTIGTLITSQATQDLPLNGRNVLNLITTSAGVTGGLSNAMSSGTRPDDRRQGSNFAANGQSDENNNNLIDGMDNNERFIGSVGVRPSIDAIQEVRVLTNLYTAEVSRTVGGVVDLITKSGTNQFHGTAYEFFRNDVLDARDFFSTTGRKPELRQNQFGGSIGGPIVKNKVFFFFDYEGFRLVKGVTQTSTVPTAFEEDNPGNFSDLGPGCTVIAPSAIQTIGLNYFKLYPAPTSAPPIPGNCAPPTNNFTFTAGQTQFTNTYDSKVDYRFSDRDSAFARYTYNTASSFIPGLYPVVNGINPGAGPYGANFAGPASDQEQNGALSYTHVFSSNKVLQLNASYLRLNNQSDPVNAGKDVATAFGFPCNATSCVNLPGDVVSSGLPNISFSQPYGALGDADYVPLVDQNNTFQYTGSLSWIKGNHSLKIGAGLIRRQVQETQSAHPRGLINIQNSYTGNSLGDLLTDQAANVTRNYTVDTPAFRSWEDSVYIQDDWRVMSALTLNLGLRYDVYTPFTAANDAFSNFDPNLNLLVGPSLPGIQKSGATAGVKTDYGDVAPRLGFAYTAAPGLVVRGGYGLTFFPGNSTSGAFMKNAPFTFSFGCGTAASTSSGPCPAGFVNPADGQGYLLSTGLPIPSTNIALATDPANYIGTTIYSTDFNYKNSYLQQFSANVEKDFHGNVVTLAYVGNKGSRLVMANVNINQRPFAGAAFPIAALPNVTIQQRTSNLSSNYNAFQASVARRLRAGLAANVNYTLARNLTNAQVIDEGQPVGNCWGPCHVDSGNGGVVTSNLFRYDYGNGDIDVRHRIALTTSYELPFGKSASGFRGEVEKGWSINSIYYWQTGNPFTVQNSNGNQSGIGLGNDRPNMVASSQPGFHKSIAQWFDVTRFQLQGTGLLGNEPRNPVYGPGTQALSFSLFKEFPIHESIALQFRAESFNLFNTPTFATPNTTITSYNANGIGVPNVSAGQISSTVPSASPRQLQFALKLLF